MKMINIITIVATMFTIMISPQGVALESNQPVINVSAKCFVDLYGGVQAIVFAATKSDKLGQLANKMTNKSVKVGGDKTRKKIYKTHQCVLIDEKFTSAIANQLDAVTPK